MNVIPTSQPCLPALGLGLGLQGRPSAFRPVTPDSIFTMGPRFQDISIPFDPRVLQFSFNPVSVSFGDPSNAVFLQHFLPQQKNLLNSQNLKPDFRFPAPLPVVTSNASTLPQNLPPSGTETDAHSPSASLSIQFDKKSSTFFKQHELQNSSTRSNSSLSEQNSYPLDEEIDDVSESLLPLKRKMMVVSALALTKTYGMSIYQRIAASTPQIEGNIKKKNLKCVACQDKF
ncbi:hypothetical protein FO519_010147, partial [Halicephalobus sp. NKZ332]